MKLRRLTELGLNRFSSYLAQLRDDPKLSPPAWLLEDEESSSPAAEIEVAPREFTNRLDAATYLSELLATSNLTAIDQDVGLWSWLSLFYFDQVCPVKKNAARKPSKEDARYIPSVTDFQKFYRHLLLGPYVIFQSHTGCPERALSLLASPVHVISDVVEQMMSRKERLSNPAIVALATGLYVDTDSMKYKKGAGGKGSGSPRRLHEVLEQFERTFDLFGMEEQELRKLLPKEFKKFL